MKTIYEFADYRQFLTKIYLDRKREKLSYSYAQFSKEASLGSPNYLKLVIDGKRNLTCNNIQSFGHAVGLAADELEFFEALVLENQAADARERRFYHGRLVRMKKVRKSNQQYDFDRKKSSVLLEDSKRMAALLMASQKTPELAKAAIAEELKISIAESESMLKVLERDETVQIRDGLIHLAGKHTMVSDRKGKQNSQRNYMQTSIAELTKVFHERYPLLPAKFLSLLLTSRSGSLDDIFHSLRLSAEKTAVDHEPEAGDAAGVYRIQIQVYRVHQAAE